MSFQIYRNTSVGESLMETIEELAVEGTLPEELALTILKQFDTVSPFRLEVAGHRLSRTMCSGSGGCTGRALSTCILAWNGHHAGATPSSALLAPH